MTMTQDENEGGKAGQAKQDDQIAALLPFYVNGTLSGADILFVERALAGSPSLRTELLDHQSLYRIVKAGGAVLAKGDDIREDNIQANLDIVLGRIGAQTPATNPATDPVTDPAANAMYTAVRSPAIGTAEPKATTRSFAQMLGFLHPKRWHPVAVLSLALAVPAQAAIIASMSAERKQGAVQMAALEKRLGDLEFQLASGPAGGAARGSIILVLTDDANWAAVSQLLTREGLSILSGPHDGALTLSNAAKGTALDAQIIRLKASPLVASADKAA